MARRWSVITVTYNSLRHLETHWAAEPRTRDFDWIVVDNGSTDGSFEFAKESATLALESGGNFGFAKANNIGLAEADSDYVAFANPDVTIPGRGWQEMMEHAIQTTNGLVAPQLLNANGSEQANSRGLPLLSAKIRNRLKPDSRKGRDYARTGFQEPTYCAWVMGAALAGRTSSFRELGGWDESYFLYYEDHEIGLRAWRNGIPVVLEPRVRWIHDWQRATTTPNVGAWRVEFQSMRKFYSAHPEFLVGSATRSSVTARIRNAGYEEMCDKLWRPVSSQSRLEGS